ncbi:hypothetical protein DSM112329_02176 [Paraconexibacter sp. AEG42_29]|uniref:FHA domain-containing protein n=1 Tax=Paraconexibacter sp. AEG42_29 TaxID=2997339 RepID=A0AAU7AUG3_9ACTN
MSTTSRAQALKDLLAAERAGSPFLVVQPPDAVPVVRPLPGHELTVGRSDACDVVLADARVSRLHLRIWPVPGGWATADDGLPRNGTFVNGTRISGPRRLIDGDVVLVGSCTLTFRDPSAGTIAGTTLADSPLLATLRITPAQRRVLVELSRPCRGPGVTAPATNLAIAEALVLSVDTVKSHLKALFEQFAVGEIPNNAKRARLAEIALGLGVLTEADFAPGATQEG